MRPPNANDRNDNNASSWQGLSSSSLSQHPAFAAYERFASETPFVTRCLIYLQWFTYLLSWLVPHPTTLDLALSNYPIFTMYKWELYRILTCGLVNDRFSDLVFVYLLVVPAAKSLERAIGSSRFLYLTGTLWILSNLLFLVTWLVLSTAFASSSSFWTSQSTSSLWIVGFGFMSMEAMISDADNDRDSDNDDTSGPKYRKVCCWTVRTRHAPLALYGLMGLLSFQYDLGCLVSLLLGYAVGHQHGHNSSTDAADSSAGVMSRILELLDRVMVSAVSHTYLQRCEESGFLAWCVANHSRPSSRSSGGWVTVPMATGIRAWNVATSNGSTESMLPLFQMPARRATGASGEAAGGRVLGSSGSGSGGSVGGGDAVGRGGGVGSLSPRSRTGPSGADEARAARLQALDRASRKSGGNSAPSDAAS